MKSVEWFSLRRDDGRGVKIHGIRDQEYKACDRLERARGEGLGWHSRGVCDLVGG
jgi:hypothetical protein